MKHNFFELTSNKTRADMQINVALERSKIDLMLNRNISRKRLD